MLFVSRHSLVAIFIYHTFKVDTRTYASLLSIIPVWQTGKQISQTQTEIPTPFFNFQKKIYETIHGSVNKFQ